MFNENFYPTPAHVVDLMVAPYTDEYSNNRLYLKARRILEPSAGKGDIINRLIEKYNIRKEYVSCIEYEQELQFILRANGYKVIDSDFLTYDDPYDFDFIIMNPPFDDGASHLLKAWHILKNGRIACLLNAETIRNPCTRERALLLDIIQEHGSYKEIGAVFANAERRSNVECVIVWLEKETENAIPMLDERDLQKDDYFDESQFSANPLASNDMMQALADQCTRAMRILIEKHKLESEYRYFTRDVISTHDESSAITSLNKQIDDLKASFWQYVFRRTKLGTITTSNYQKQFTEMSAGMSRLAFTKENIMRVIEFFILNRGDIMQKCILEAFDKATQYHEDNRTYTEGWVTNKSWRCNKKIIMPNGVSYDNGHWSSYYYHRDFFSDIDKALCFLSGKKYDDIDRLEQAMTQHMENIRSRHVQYNMPFLCEFFTVRIYKKGTVHLTFLDLDLLDAFNQAAAKGKNWIGKGD